ncbi:hypothetical protein SSIL_1386 [Solibacillus silvestris StLB046]|uniref:Uncharacterized protein n=1 Tax=Solibacillus silvestris (strain StLB046) TaxID=1002809 RepID=F2F2H1_SOLSS|nr:hypothetical protein [Solibacillus silvestris]BAK15809.1 hypothetical protein SSIL_1386 [Solibacillus silvestris StLB046]
MAFTDFVSQQNTLHMKKFKGGDDVMTKDELIILVEFIELIFELSQDR